MHSSEDCPIVFQPGRQYSVEEFLSLNDWLKSHEFVFEGNLISHFERNQDKTLSPIPAVTMEKEGVVAEIIFQLEYWNTNSKQNGFCTGSQGGYKFGEGIIRVPDVAFTPRNTYCGLSDQQSRTFQGDLFCPTFVVEVDDFSSPSLLDALTTKFRNTYFPAGVRLGWLLDPINKTIFTFMRDSNGVVQRRRRQWYDGNGNARKLSGGLELPSFMLKLQRIDNKLSKNKASPSAPDRSRLNCPKCDQVFFLKQNFMEHFLDDH